MKLKDIYEGRCVLLACKVGDTLYSSVDGLKYTVIGIKIMKDHTYYTAVNVRNHQVSRIHFEADDVGDTLFFNKEDIT